jgi:hypothetical protein
MIFNLHAYNFVNDNESFVCEHGIVEPTELSPYCIAIAQHLSHLILWKCLMVINYDMALLLFSGCCL